MFLRVKCPNGHALKVPHKFAGQQGVCPVCKAKVRIPPIERDREVSEDAILDLIGTGGSSPSTVSRYAASRDDLPGNEPAEPEDRGVLDDQFETTEDDSSLLKIRKCPQCQKKVPPHFHVCPNCSTYLMEDDQVAEGKATMSCPTCGARSFPGTEVCEQCGTRLFLKE